VHTHSKKNISRCRALHTPAGQTTVWSIAKGGYKSQALLLENIRNGYQLAEYACERFRSEHKQIRMYT